MGKMDIQHAYWSILVVPEDRRLLGMRWQGKVYIDKVLPFGLRSAPLIISTVADALQFIISQQGATWLVHYLHDFSHWGPASRSTCSVNMEIMNAVRREAGLPIEPTKTVGPATTISFLGIELDSKEGIIRLPKDKLSDLKAQLRVWRKKKASKSGNCCLSWVTQPCL